MNSTMAETSKSVGGLDRRGVFLRTAMAMGVVLLGVAGMAGAEWAFNLQLNKPPAPLVKPLETIPDKIGPYEQEGIDRRLEPTTAEKLAADDYLLREYVDTREPANKRSPLALNVNYYASGSATPHVPDICWAGAGMARKEFYEFVVKDVKHRDGRVSDLVVRMSSFEAPSRIPGLQNVQGRDQRINVAYVFHVNGRYVANAIQVNKYAWDVRSAHSYHAKIEVTHRVPCAPEDAEKPIGDFLRTVLAEIEACLPAAGDSSDTASARAAHER